jgi:hypothetical protein
MEVPAQAAFIAQNLIIARRLRRFFCMNRGSMQLSLAHPCHGTGIALDDCSRRFQNGRT